MGSHRNVLLLIGDDHGFEIGSYGNPVIQTPNLDWLAAEGTRFTNGFANVTISSPFSEPAIPTHPSRVEMMAYLTAEEASRPSRRLDYKPATDDMQSLCSDWAAWERPLFLRPKCARIYGKSG